MILKLDLRKPILIVYNISGLCRDYRIDIFQKSKQRYLKSINFLCRRFFKFVLRQCTYENRLCPDFIGFKSLSIYYIQCCGFYISARLLRLPCNVLETSYLMLCPYMGNMMKQINQKTLYYYMYFDHRNLLLFFMHQMPITAYRINIRETTTFLSYKAIVHILNVLLTYILFL